MRGTALILNGAVLCGLTAAHRVDVERHQQQLSTKGQCKESFVADKCECNHWSWGNFGHLCSSCKDNKKWGVGCDLDCPEECTDGCDFGGSCLITQSCPENCKDGGRLDRPDGHCLNSRYECEQCKRGFYGKKCESQCPSGCGESPEGVCTRGGVCFKCNAGFFGDDCASQCPSACPDCVMRDNTVPDPSNPGSFLKAGMCTKECKGNVWGPTCSDSCPEHCTPPSKKNSASCDRISGDCKSCEGNQWWGPKCEESCSDGCAGGTCEKDGGCLRDCIKGRWGEKCDQPCPEGAGSCSRNDGMPLDCVEGQFPSRDEEGKGFCKPCPENCQDSKCHADGVCSAGCVLGFHGDICDKPCSESCDGPCDAFATKKTDGHCAACKGGFTGPTCSETCHATCGTCKQTGSGFMGSSRSGNSERDCLSCRDDGASVLGKSGSCDCIEGAVRTGEDSKCRCSAPADERKEAFMEITRDLKRCTSRCSTDFNGVALKKVFNDDDSKSHCISSKLFKSVILAAGEAETLEAARPKFRQGACEEGSFEFDDDLDKCLDEQFIAYILRV